MKKLFVALAGVVVLSMSSSPVLAIAPFNQAFKDKYVKAGAPYEQLVKGAACNLCHDGKDRKKHNVYGLALKMYLKKVDFVGEAKKYDPKSDEGKKALDEGLQKAGAEKSPSGKTFEELIKAGELPAPVVK